MKQKIVFFLILFMFFFQWNIYWNWNSPTFINSETTFQKIHGTSRVLNTYEDYFINPFQASTIVRNTTTTTNRITWTTTTTLQNYTVDNVVFNNRHPLYYTKWTKMNWVLQSPWILTQIEYLQDSFTFDEGIIMPNQNVKVRKYYKVSFNYDTTPPTCWDIQLFNDENLIQSFTYNGGWLNQPKYFTLECRDLETWCKCEEDDMSCEVKWWNVISTPKPIWHLTQPTVSFINNVDLRNNECTWMLPWWKLVMYDAGAPQILLTASLNNTSFRLQDEANRNYESSQSGEVFYTTKEDLHFKANDENTLIFNISDRMLEGSVNGVSWLQKMSIEILKKNGVNFAEVFKTGAVYPQYNPNWIITNSDIKSITLTHFDMSKAWEYKIVIHAHDWANNYTRATSFFNIYPNDLDIAKSTLTLSGSTGDKYANNSDFYHYILTLKDRYENPIYGKKLAFFNQECWGETWCKTITTNMINNSWSDAIRELIVWWETNTNGQINIRVYWLAPGEFNQRFKIRIPQWDDKYEDTNQNQERIISILSTNSFKKPYTWQLTLQVPQDGKISLGTASTYNLKINNEWTISTTYLIGDFKDSLIPYDNINHQLIQISNVSWLNNAHPSFQATLIAASWATSMSLDNVWVKISPHPIITYKLWGFDILYNLTTDSSDYGIQNPIHLKNTSEFLWVQVVWVLQWAGNSNFTGQAENFSDLSTSTLRTQIRKNAYEYILTMTDEQLLWWVKFINGKDVEISGWNLWYETLVVKNGNVIITWDLTQQKLWIIVLKDNYNVHTDFATTGNVYVIPDVKKIHALIYADGWFISTDKDKKPYMNTSQASWDLQTQLVMKWSLFTRNTIWGAIKQPYILPGWWNTSSFDSAMLYDLNYIRRWKNNCEKKISPQLECIYDKWAFVIVYDSSLQSSPPKLFWN